MHTSPSKKLVLYRHILLHGVGGIVLGSDDDDDDDDDSATEKCKL